MILGVTGVPSPLTYLMTNVARSIVQIACGEHHMLGVNSLADLREAWPAKTDRKPAVVLASDMPRADFIAFLLETKAPQLVCLDSMENICEYFITCRNLDSISAMRVATHSLSNLEILAQSNSNSIFLIQPSPQASLLRVVQEIREFCKLPSDNKAVVAVLEYLGFGQRGGILFSEFLSESRRALFPALDGSLNLREKEFSALTTLARSYNRVLAREVVEEVEWPPMCFLIADTPGVTADGDMSLEGRARFLSHGPYFHLPAGLWSVEMEMEVQDSLSDNRVGFDVFAGNVLAACTAVLPTDGSFACDMVFRASDPTVAIEIRIQLLSGAIEGQLRLLGAKLRRIPESQG